MKQILLLSIVWFCVYGCKKGKICDCATPFQVYCLKAKVIQTNDIACHLPVLDFTEDSVRIRNITSLNTLEFSVINLPNEYIIKDKQLYVMVSLLKPEEEFACNTFGIVYPHVKVTDVKNRN